MSKHINFVCRDTLYSNIVEFMNDNNITNLSWAIRILLFRAFDSIRKEKEEEQEKNDHIRNITFLRDNCPF